MIPRGLREVLRTGNITRYPALCAEVTANFAVLSDTINKVLNHTTTSQPIQQLLKQLQSHEREKLNLTAALHLEQLRRESSLEAAVSHQENSNNSNNGTTDSNDDRIRLLLESSISSLAQKIAVFVEDITQVLEELRYLALDEDEE